MIGVSAKSFGHYFFNHRDAGALGYLGVAPQFAGRLPGTEVTDASAAWLLELQRDYADLLPGTRVSRPAYVARQLWAWLQDFRAGGLEAAELWQRLKLLSGRDLVGLAGLLTRPEARAHVLRSLRRLRGASSRTDPLWETLHELPGIDDIASFAEWWTSHHGGVGAGVSGSRTA